MHLFGVSPPSVFCMGSGGHEKQDRRPRDAHGPGSSVRGPEGRGEEGQQGMLTWRSCSLPRSRSRSVFGLRGQSEEAPGPSAYAWGGLGGSRGHRGSWLSGACAGVGRVAPVTCCGIFCPCSRSLFFFFSAHSMTLSNLMPVSQWGQMIFRMAGLFQSSCARHTDCHPSPRRAPKATCPPTPADGLQCPQVTY